MIPAQFDYEVAESAEHVVDLEGQLGGPVTDVTAALQAPVRASRDELWLQINGTDVFRRVGANFAWLFAAAVQDVGVSIVKGGPNPANARKFMDFVNSKQAHQMIVDIDKRRSARSDAPRPSSRRRRNVVSACPPLNDWASSSVTRGGADFAISLRWSRIAS